MVQIDFKDVFLSFGNSPIVENFNLSIKKGEIITFFGPSGCGKSSIMKLVLGINSPDSGSVKIGDQSAGQYKNAVAYVPQDNELLPWLSIRDNVKMWAQKTNNLRSVDQIIEMVGLQNDTHKLPNMLSGGMARRTTLARGLATQSDILCLDEAMVGIEKTMRYALLINIRNHIKKLHKTAIFISHDYEETIFLSDRIIVFTPPPTSIAKEINVAANTDNSERDNTFIGSIFFKDIYSQLLS